MQVVELDESRNRNSFRSMWPRAVESNVRDVVDVSGPACGYIIVEAVKDRKRLLPYSNEFQVHWWVTADPEILFVVPVHSFS